MLSIYAPTNHLFIPMCLQLDQQFLYVIQRGVLLNDCESGNAGENFTNWVPIN